MIPSEVIEGTKQRYRERGGIREEKAPRVAVGAVMAINDADRIGKRLARVASVEAAATPVSTGGLVEPVVQPTAARRRGPVEIALERVIGQSDLVGIGYLAIALRVSRSVGCIELRSRTGRVLGHGTGFMVSPRLLLTNNHVLQDPDQAVHSQVAFNFERGPEGLLLTSVAFELDPSAFFVTHPALDYSLVAVRPTARDGTALAEFGWLPLIEEQGKVLEGEYVNIIQHPNGEPKQLALRENQVVDLFDDFLHYQTDTAPGSSGSPVFNDQWEVVALHHSGVPKYDDQGRILTTGGTPWTDGMGEHQIAWVANEGVRISRIVGHIKAQRLDGDGRRLRNDLFELAPPALGIAGGTPTRRTDAATSPAVVVGADGTATWTVPLQVSVRLGQAPPAPVVRTGETPPSRPVGTGGTTERPEPPPPAEDSPEVREALVELEAARARPYYDARADRRARDAYYAGLPGSLTKAELFNRLRDLLKTTHTQLLPYRPTTQLYPSVDLHPDFKLRSIDSGQTFDPAAIIRADGEVDRRRARLREVLLAESTAGAELQPQELDLLEARYPYNCEHVVPQSWFGKRDPMRGDLHHLFTCESDCNSFRGNTPYFDFQDFGEVERTDCGKRVENKFEPEAGKGAVARASLYFLLRYPGEINHTSAEYRGDRLKILLAWHEGHPVGEYEKHRNATIQARQGNRNPLIDFPEWAAKIDFARGLG